MAYGLPSIGEGNWGQKILDSFGFVKGELDGRLSPSSLSASFDRVFGVLPSFGDGVTDATAHIQAKIDAAAAAGGGDVKFPEGIFLTQTLTIKTGVRLLGSGISATTLKLKNNTNAALIETLDFAALTVGNTTGGPSRFSIENLTLDGNKANQSSGNGINIYGYYYAIRNVDLKNAKGIGLYSQWSTTGLVNPDPCEAYIEDLAVHECGGDGIDWAGPHDSTWRGITSFRNNPTGKGFWVRSGASKHVAVQCHAWGTHAYGWYLEGVCDLIACQGEGASVQLMIGVNDCSVIGGHYFAGTDGTLKGIEIGDASHTSIAGSVIETKVSLCSGGAFDFTYAGAANIVSGVVYQTSGTAIIGTPPATNAGTLLVNGIAGTICPTPEVALPNLGYVKGRETGGTLRPLMGLGSDNRVKHFNTSAGLDFINSAQNAVLAHLTDSGNWGLGTRTEFGSGTKVLGIQNATTAPSANPATGGVAYAEAGALRYRTSSGTIQTVAGDVVAKSANATLTTAEKVCLATGGASGITITLPAAVQGSEYVIKKVDSDAGAVTVATTSSQTIDGATTKVLSAQYAYVRVVSNGTSWSIIAAG